MFLIFCVTIISIIIVPQNSIAIDEKFTSNDITYCFYTDADFKKCDDSLVIDNGVCKMIYCDYKKAKAVKKYIDNIYGESMAIYNINKSDLKILSKKIQKTVVFNEKIDKKSIFYCYDSKLSNFVLIKNQKINMQVVFENNDATIGYPIILGEY